MKQRIIFDMKKQNNKIILKNEKTWQKTNTLKRIKNV